MLFKNFLPIFFCLESFLLCQTFIPAENDNLIKIESHQFDNLLKMETNMFRPIFFNTDTTALSIKINSESYFNNNATNQENMDVRYFSKGLNTFNSIQLALNSRYISLLIEPYFISNNNYNTSKIARNGIFSVLNDGLSYNTANNYYSTIRNFLLFLKYKNIGVGYHNGNKWWGPGLHSSLQMSNNTYPIPSFLAGNLNEIKFGKLGLQILYSFSQLNNEEGSKAHYLTSLNASLAWHGSAIWSIGFSRNYITGGKNISNYVWSKSDAQKIIFEGLFTSDLIGQEYTVAGHDLWDQTLSGYFAIIYPEKNIKAYLELGFNDNRMYFADFLSQPDHSMASIIGLRDYGDLKKKITPIWGFEWTNLMITYSSRFRLAGPGTWYDRKQYNYSSYKGRRWSAHSGSDSDDIYVYAGIRTKNIILYQGLNYERHGIVSHRPAEVKLESISTIQLFHSGFWFTVYYENQLEAFLGFPDYFYVDSNNNPINEDNGILANNRKTSTLKLKVSKIIKF